MAEQFIQRERIDRGARPFRANLNKWGPHDPRSTDQGEARNRR